MTSASASRHGRGTMPEASTILLQSRTELAGRRAGVGYSAVVIATTPGGGPRHGTARWRSASANPYQLTAPAPVKWNKPQHPLPALMRAVIATIAAAMSAALVGDPI